jgi:hypothetical protein
MRTIFSSENIAELKANPSVFSISERSIMYTCEFKLRALELHAQGVSAKEIWRRSGFDISRWKKDYCRYNIRDWRRIVQRRGLKGLSNWPGRQIDHGPSAGETIDTDKVRRLELQVKYLKAENSFLAKLRAKRGESNSGLVKNTNS